MIVVTGGAGFIGSCIIAQLNAIGWKEIVVVDEALGNDPKKRNLEQKHYKEYIEKGDFLKLVRDNKVHPKIESIIHMGACSSTTGTDVKYYEENNFLYTKTLAEWCLKNNIRFIYASSAATYGDGHLGYKDDEQTTRQLQPLNIYGASKQKFDLWALDQKVLDKVVGLKFFNVFGPNEYHKGDMRSVMAKAFQRVSDEGKISLFKSYHPDYADGEQKRDFIYVKDAVDVVMFFLENPLVNGLYNLGTGMARTWNDVAKALFASVGKPVHVEYIDMPEHLRPRYQYFTQADMSKLRAAGYTKAFMPLEDSIKDYAKYLKHHKYL